ncbi:DUF4184 family protein [Virgisporangium ochraceum]|uniref:DUF4184 family protein n=1 Tax=Virgisporangium ochraceum TaxID=65505 RepID=A0A8J4EH43_9ACTN|nr:DUF4184 family protein [Virgisporangium ochraceum]GIJ74589.1 hypothetical protein Voc01_095060 [Virgisporangium ochraceum]
MPLTLPTHPMAVLPLKVWRPRWFDGVALVVGAVAPDLPYAADGYPLGFRAHAWLAPFWWAAPLALLCVPLVRWTAGRVAVHLPAAGPLRLRDYGVLALVRHRWWVTATSAALGAYSHILWDSVTHDTINHRPIPLRGLTSEAVPGWLWYEVLSKASNAVGLLAAVGLAVHMGRTRALVRWHGPAPDGERRPVRFWGTVVAVTAAGAATLPFQPYPGVFPTQAIRCLLIGCAALVAGACAVALVPTRHHLDVAGRRPGME